jgi:hypothetical protein
MRPDSALMSWMTVSMNPPVPQKRSTTVCYVDEPPLLKLRLKIEVPLDGAL